MIQDSSSINDSSGYFADTLTEMVKKDASDLYITLGYPLSIRINDDIIPLSDEPVSIKHIHTFLTILLDEEKRDEFQTTLELNFAFVWQNTHRFRVNIYRQQQHSAIVIRRINTRVPTIKALGLPDIYGDIAMKRQGLVLIVGSSGSGKSTSVAAMVDHRNSNGFGHIITIEDPTEYVHEHKQCIISQREVGIDTYSYGIALKNSLRQRADMATIGEIRDRETMEHALAFSSTGHLCVATIHSQNSSQAIERIMSLFPEESHQHLLVSLSQNLLCILGQKLVPTKQQEHVLALEILPNEGLIKKLIEENRLNEIKDHMERQSSPGTFTFDHSLLELYKQGTITVETALAESDNPSNLRLRLKQADSMAKEQLDKNEGF